MKTYKETVHKLGKGMFNHYMNGDILVAPYGADIVGFIFNVSEKQVLQDAEKEFKNIQKEYYDKRKK